MAIDKRINFRGGGMDMGNVGNQARSASMGNTTSRGTSPGTGGSKGNIGGGGGGQESDYRRYKAPTKPTYTAATIDQKPITGADFQRSQNEFINNLNINNASRFVPTPFNRTYKPVTLDTVGSRPRGGDGLGNLFKTLFGFATGIPIGLFNKGKSGITNINNALGDFREKFTGYRTQQEYDDARQQRINLNRINTIQNTLDRKYPDGDYSNTDLDERLADLKQSMGILDVATVNEVDDRPTQTFSFDSTEFNNRNQPILSDPFANTVGTTANTTQIQPPDFMFGSPQFQEGLDNSMYGGDRMLLGSNSPNELYYRGDVLPGGMVIESDADGITNYDFDNQPTGIELAYNFSDIDNQVAELTNKQKAFIKNKQFALQENLINADDVFNTINNPDLGIYDKGIMGFSEQEPTTLEEYNNYLQSLGINQRAV
jgi:hypothetical protein